MLDARWKEPLDVLLDWLGARFPATGSAAASPAGSAG